MVRIIIIPFCLDIHIILTGLQTPEEEHTVIQLVGSILLQHNAVLLKYNQSAADRFLGIHCTLMVGYSRKLHRQISIAHLTAYSAVGERGVAIVLQERTGEVERLAPLIVHVHQAVGLRLVIVHTAFRYSTRHFQSAQYAIAIAPPHHILGKGLVALDHRLARPVGHFVLIEDITHQGGNRVSLIRAWGSSRVRTRVTRVFAGVELKDIVRRITGIGVNTEEEIGLVGIGFSHDG